MRKLVLGVLAAALASPLATLRATVAMEPVSLLPAPAALGPNFVVNPGFETGNTTGYTVTPAASGSAYGLDDYPPDAHSGTYSFVFGGTTAGFYDTLSQTLTTVPGATYSVSFWLKNLGSPVNPGANPLGNGFMSSFGNTPLLNFTDGDAIDYTQFTYTVTATNASTVLSFAGYQVPASIRLDDISVTLATVPEPSTLALLGVGVVGAGIVALRRQRTA